MPLKEVEYVQGIDKKCQETIKQGYTVGHICILSEDRHYFFWIISRDLECGSLPYLSHMPQSEFSLKTSVQTGWLKTIFLHCDIVMIEVIRDVVNGKVMLATPLITAAVHHK